MDDYFTKWKGKIQDLSLIPIPGRRVIKTYVMCQKTNGDNIRLDSWRSDGFLAVLVDLGLV